MTEITPDIFETEAMQHIDDLYRTASRLTMSQTDAEDLVQETYMQAWKSFENYEPGTNCRAWLYKIMFHVVHHHRRKQFRYVSATVEADELGLEDTLRYEPPVAEYLSEEEVLAALDRLPEHYRDVVLLVDVEELSYKEAAAALDVPIGTVMSRLSRGRAVLRGELAGVAPDYGVVRRRA